MPVPVNVQEDGLPEDTLDLTHTVEFIMKLQYLSHLDPPFSKSSKLPICGPVDGGKEQEGRRVNPAALAELASYCKLGSALP